jgi:hypothetical protein
VKKPLPLIIGLALVIAVGLFYDRAMAVPRKTVPGSAASAPLSPTVIPTPTPVMKKYTNQKLGLSFDYPADPGFTMEKLDQDSKNQLLYLHFYSGPDKTQKFISVEVYSGDLTLLPPGPTPADRQNVLLGYQRTTINKINFEQYLLNGPCMPRTLQTVYKKRTYIFQDVCGPTPGFEQLIFSLKFL